MTDERCLQFDIHEIVSELTRLNRGLCVRGARSPLPVWRSIRGKFYTVRFLDWGFSLSRFGTTVIRLRLRLRCLPNFPRGDRSRVFERRISPDEQFTRAYEVVDLNSSGKADRASYSKSTELAIATSELNIVFIVEVWLC